MAYYFRKTLFHLSFDTLLDKLIWELYKEGFTIINSADIGKILKAHRKDCEKRYELLNVIIPHLYCEMLCEAPFDGLLLPCNISMIEIGNNNIELIAINPSEIIADTIDGPTFKNLTFEISRRLNSAINLLSQKSPDFAGTL